MRKRYFVIEFTTNERGERWAYVADFSNEPDPTPGGAVIYGPWLNKRMAIVAAHSAGCLVAFDDGFYVQRVKE